MLKKMTTSIMLITMTGSVSAQTFSDKALDQVWGERKESDLARVGLYAPRLVGGALKNVFLGRTAKRVVTTGVAGVNAAVGSLEGDQEQVALSGYQAADSAVNVLGLGHDMVADIGASVKGVTSATSYTSSRIKVCTTNLMSNIRYKLTYEHFFNPAYHVGNLIDGQYDETADGGAYPDQLRRHADKGIKCDNVPVLSNEPESIAIERLTCTDTHFEVDYDFVGYNCAGYTRDVLKVAGLGYPTFLNMGIGSELDLKRIEKGLRGQKEEVAAICDDHIAKVRKTILLTSEGRTLPTDLMAHFEARTFRGNRVSADLALQLIILASTSKNEALREQVSDITYTARKQKEFHRVYYKANDPETRELSRTYHHTLKNIMAANPGARIDREWLRSLDTEIDDLIVDISKLK